jgi:hypothetical protein
MGKYGWHKREEKQICTAKILVGQPEGMRLFGVVSAKNSQ